MEKENIPGYSIPKRPLTLEEKTREVTVERISAYHYAAGESFTDTHGSEFNKYIFGGFLLARHPEWKKEIIAVINDKYGEMLTYEDIFTNHYDETNPDDWEVGFNAFYGDVCDYINLTVGLKERINQILIQVTEYYGDE